jgi:hypothetical protein
VKAAQDEASPAALRRKTPEAQGFLLVEFEGVHRWILLEAHDAGSVNLCDGRTKAATATVELTENYCDGLGPSLNPPLKALLQSAPHHPFFSISAVFEVLGKSFSTFLKNVCEYPI